MSQEIMKNTVEHDQWGELHPDLLHEIVKHFQSSKDYVRFRAVCKSWNLNLPKTPNHIRGPWLVLPFNNESFEIEAKDFYLRLPEMQKTLLRGSCFEWLISIGIDGVLRMLNPFTKTHFDLPPMSTIPDIVVYRPDMQDEEYTISDIRRNGRTYTTNSLHIQKMHLQKIIISSPPDNQDFTAMTIYGEYNRLALCRFGDDKWIDFSTPEIIDCGLEDAIFHEGKIYAIDWKARLFEFDVKTSIGAISEVPRPHDLYIPFADLNTKYLICNVDGDLLMAIRHLKSHQVGSGENEASCYKTSSFDIYKLDKSAKQWTRMFSLGNYVLVVGFNSSICMCPFPDGKGDWVRNCIYYTDNMVESHYKQITGGHDIGVFNFEDGRNNQLFPTSEFLYPPPIWLFSQNFIS